MKLYLARDKSGDLLLTSRNLRKTKDGWAWIKSPKTLEGVWIKLPKYFYPEIKWEDENATICKLVISRLEI